MKRPKYESMHLKFIQNRIDKLKKNNAYFYLEVVTTLLDSFNLIIKLLINDGLALTLLWIPSVSIQLWKTSLSRKQNKTFANSTDAKVCKFAHSPNIKSTLLPSWRAVCKFDCNQSTCSQFHQHFMCSFFVREPKIVKKTVKSSIFLTLSGSACAKASQKYVGEIYPRSS